MTRLMRVSHRLLVIAALVCVAGLTPLLSQDDGGFGSAEAGEALAGALAKDPTCSAAAARYSKCRWGSSADTEFAPIVISKCETTFLDKLSAPGKERYFTEMQLCAYEYARAEGTLAMSEAASCQVDVAAAFSANPKKEDHAAPRTSFDCAKALTALEKAICSDISLGHADIILSRVYTAGLKTVKPEEKEPFIQNERHWLSTLPEKCGLGSSSSQKLQHLCIRNAFEERFTALDDCGQEDISCLQAANSTEASEQETSTASGERASFDCEAPSTAMEIAICADVELGKADMDLAEAYHAADGKLGAAKHRDLVESERQWLHYVNANCPMGVVGGIPPLLTRSCIKSALEVRASQLRACPRKQADRQIPCLNTFAIMAKDADSTK